jgi:thiol-disulfide isomerase/thioredoxin
MKIPFIAMAFFFSILYCEAQQISDLAMEKELSSLHHKTTAVRDSVKTLMTACEEQIKITNDLATLENLRIYEDSLWNIGDRNDIEELKINLNYAKQHPSSLYCLELVKSQIARQPGKNFYDDFEEVYNNASAEVKQSDSGKKMAKQLQYFKMSKVGSVAPFFFGKDIEGNEISLQDFKDKKYVLIDFWASYCAPCREELPYIKEIYAKYNELGFAVVSVSTDKNLESWKAAILKEGIEKWRHFSAAQNSDSILQDYFVNGIPHKVLIDKNGIIIGKWKGSGELNRKSLENQLKRIFKR